MEWAERLLGLHSPALLVFYFNTLDFGDSRDTQASHSQGTWQWAQLVCEERGQGSREHAGGDV